MHRTALALRQRRPRRVAVFAAVLALAAGCTGGTGPNPAPQRPKVTMTVAVAAEPSTLNPLAGYAPDGAAQFYDGLLEHREDGRLDPKLAAALPQPDAAGTTWTVPVRTGVTFADGATLTPADVVATYRAVLDPAFRSPLRARFAVLRAVDAAPDGTVRFTLTRPDPDFGLLLTLGIVPARALAVRKPVDQLPLATRPDGTGPFTLTAWQHGRDLVMAARPRYFGGKPTVDQVTVRFVPDEDARLNAVRSGAADAAEVGNQVRRSGVDGAETVPSASAEYRGVVLPAHNPVTDDPAVRKAMNFAIDRTRMISGALGGIGEPAYTPFIDAQPEYVDPAAVYPYDLGSAATLLDGAGWRLGMDGVRSRRGAVAGFTLRYPPGDLAARNLATAFAVNLAVVGIRVTPQAGQPDPGDAALVSAGDPFDPDPGTVPGTGPRSPVTLALAAARLQTDPAQRAVAYRAADRAYLGDPTMVVLARMEHTYVVAGRWRGYQAVRDPADPGFTWGLFHDLATWTQ